MSRRGVESRASKPLHRVNERGANLKHGYKHKTEDKTDGRANNKHTQQNVCDAY